MQNTTARRHGPVSKYLNDPALLHKIELIRTQKVTKEQAAENLGYGSVGTLNTVLHRTAYNLLVKGLPSADTSHQFKTKLTPEQLAARDAAVARATGMNKAGKTTKATVWEQDAKDLISYVGFCRLVKKAEEAKHQ